MPHSEHHHAGTGDGDQDHGQDNRQYNDGGIYDDADQGALAARMRAQRQSIFPNKVQNQSDEGEEETEHGKAGVGRILLDRPLRRALRLGTVCSGARSGSGIGSRIPLLLLTAMRAEGGAFFDLFSAILAIHTSSPQGHVRLPIPVILPFSFLFLLYHTD